MSVPQILSPTEGEKWIAGPFTITARVTGPQNGGGFELYELAMGNATIDYHVHHKLDETLAVLEGEVEFEVARQKFRRPAGSVAFVPKGVHHGFTNHGPARARVLILFTPSGNQHEYFAILQKLFGAPNLDVPALQAAQKKYDQELIPAGQP